MNTQTKFTKDRNAVLNALNDCGVGEDLESRLNKANEELADFCANLQKSVIRQAIYNELVNRPCGIEHPDALRMGLVSAIGNLVQWDVIDALELAADIAEDVNAHGEAAAIRAMAAKVESEVETELSTPKNNLSEAYQAVRGNLKSNPLEAETQGFPSDAMDY